MICFRRKEKYLYICHIISETDNLKWMKQGNYIL